MQLAIISRKLKRTIGAVQSRRAKLRRLPRCNILEAFDPGDIGLDGSLSSTPPSRNWGRATAGPRSPMAGGRSPIATGQQPASKSGSCVMPSQSVPDLTGRRPIKLNQRVSLCERTASIRSSHRTFPRVRVHHGEAAGRLYSGRRLRFNEARS
jgi:hypothetical protein